MKRTYLIAIVILALFGSGCGAAVQPSRPEVSAVDDSLIGKAFSARSSDVQVNGEGVVTRILADDDTGSRHQRFIVRLALLISHNTDFAPRIGRLQDGDRVRFHGEYEWNQQGGLVHWTHHDPNGARRRVG